jgi:hypothetical protein
MLVKDLKVGMLLRPKDNAVFHMWSIHDLPAHLECHVPRSWRKIPKSFKSPIIYLGKAPRSGTQNSYEYRHRVFVPFFGGEVRVASECWRSVESVE